MSEQLELFVKKEVVRIPETVTIGRPMAAGYTVHYCTTRQVYRYEETMPDEDKRVRGLVMRLAAKKGWKVNEYNVTTFRGRFRAFLKGIKRTPVVVLSGRKLGAEHLEASLSRVPEA